MSDRYAMSEPEALVTQVEELHVSKSGLCTWCCCEWPCDATKLAAYLWALQQEAVRAAAAFDRIAENRTGEGGHKAARVAAHRLREVCSAEIRFP